MLPKKTALGPISLLLVLLGLAPLPTPAVAIASKPTFQVTGRVSLLSNGAQVPSGFAPKLTPDGRYVVVEMVAPAIPGAGNKSQIFRRDQWTGDVVLVSAAFAKGAVPDDVSTGSAISDDGKWIAFSSKATNLVKTDDNGHQDIFLRNMDVGTTQLISVSSNGLQGNADSINPTIDGVGDRVAFESLANDLVTGDTNSASDVFLRSWVAGTTSRVSVSTGSAQGDDGSGFPAISGDGNNVAFTSGATNLVGGDTNGKYDIFVRSIPASTTTRVSVLGAVQANGASSAPSISNNGSVVAFQSTASNLVANDTNGSGDTFAWTRATKAIQRVSLNAFGGQIGVGSYLGDAISRDGNVVAWTSKGDDVTLPAGDGKAVNVYTRNISTGFTTLIDLRPDGKLPTNSFTLDVSTDQTGRYVAYESTSADLVRHDTNATYDAFVTDTTLPIGPFTTIANFVSQQYHDFIGRLPTAGELAEGTAVITNGELSPVRYIIDKAIHSGFAVERAPVMRLYWAFFHREPDLNGFDYWTGKKEGGASLNSIAQSFAKSSEFGNTYGSLSNSDFVKLVYQNVLGRSPDAGGLAHWVAKLDSKALTRGAVMVQFSESSEGVRVIAPATDTVLIHLGMLAKLPSKSLFDSARASMGTPANPYAFTDQLFTGAAYAGRFP
jgi:hypothetical protein